MGIPSTGMCWRFLGAVSESGMAAGFVDFCDALERVAARKGVACPRDQSDLPISMDRARAGIARVVAKATGGDRRVLPSWGVGAMLDSESWGLSASATRVPHFQALVVEKRSKVEVDKGYRYGLARALVEDGAADCGRVAEGTIYGRTWSVYLLFKIQRLRALYRAYALLPSRGESGLATPEFSFPALVEALPRYSDVPEDKRVVGEFLIRCDDALTAHVGRGDLASYLRPVGVSVREFLAAG